jgi:(R,R)-butanediol dehydrogenase/meso-butanediol dehydrogenase/diacetyl reductase
MTMRAAVMRGDRFVVEERAVPTPAAGDVLVKVRACGICGSDLHYFKHAPEIIALAEGLGAPTEAMRRTLREGPVLGHEFVCEVAAFGPETKGDLPLGARVVSRPFLMRDGAPVLIGSSPEAPGAYAEFMLLSEDLLLPAAGAAPDEALALVEPLGIALHAIHKAALRADDGIAIVGCGPIGLALIAALRARGFERIAASDLSAKRRVLARELGAAEVVDGLRESVVAVATRHGAPRLVVFENTGAPRMLSRLVLEAPQGARLVVAGIPAGEESFLPMIAITKELSFEFVIYYTQEEFADALAMMERGTLDWRKLVTGKVGLDGVTQAFRDLADPEAHAKILIDPWMR